jgi:hypothetical protein
VAVSRECWLATSVVFFFFNYIHLQMGYSHLKKSIDVQDYYHFWITIILDVQFSQTVICTTSMESNASGHLIPSPWKYNEANGASGHRCRSAWTWIHQWQAANQLAAFQSTWGWFEHIFGPQKFIKMDG